MSRLLFEGGLGMSKTERHDSTRHESGWSEGERNNENSCISSALWKDGLDSADDCSLILNEMKESIDRDFEFLKEYATNVDKEVLYSLLLSQINNSNRVETIMRDVLGITNVTEIIRKFHKLEKNINEEANEKVQLTMQNMRFYSWTEFFRKINEMFPDVEFCFLERECKHLRTLEDFNRFINTVMLTGAYPKKNSAECSNKGDPTFLEDDIQVIKDDLDQPIVLYSSDEEICSSSIVEMSYSHKSKKRRSDSFNLGEGPIDIQSAGIKDFDIHKKHAGCKSRCVDSEDSKDFTMDENEIQVLPGPDASKTENLKQNVLNDFNCKRLSPTQLSMDSISKYLSLTTTSEKVPDSGCKSFVGLQLSKNVVPNCKAGTSSDKHLNAVKETYSNDFGLEEVSTTSREIFEIMECEDMAQRAQETSEEWIAEKTTELIRLFPNADPSFLRLECEKFSGSVEVLNEFVLAKLDRNDMPSRKDYEKRIEMEKLQDRYTKNFSIDDFLKVIPDPWTYFKNSDRNCSKYKLHSICFLKSAFRNHYANLLSSTLAENNFNLYLSYRELKKKKGKRLRARSSMEYNAHRPTTINIQFLQEVAFIENEEKIRDYLEAKEIERRIRFDEAKKSGSLLQCKCCFDSEVMVEETVYCPNDHSFCKACVIKYVEVQMGQGRCQFSCMAGCDEKYSLTSLQGVLNPELFSKVIQKNQMEEIKAAGIEDLVQCPFCNYATIMPPEVKVMTCLNPECQKESCRLCSELSHIPLRCDEVEKSEEIKLRTYIENKMTEALVRTCYKCSNRFVKEEGCNKMVCSCGAKMCYVCRKPVSNYDHFNGQGGTDFSKCPLYSTNDELHVDLVAKIAEEAKAEILLANPDKTLKHDPTLILPQRSYDRTVPGMDGGIALAVGLEAVRRGFPALGRVGAMNRFSQNQRGRVRQALKQRLESRNNRRRPV